MDRFTLKNWTINDYKSLILYLKDRADLTYKQFHSRLMPGYSPDYIIGIRVPVLRKIANKISKGNAREFIKFPGDNYYEEAMLYGLTLNNIKTVNYGDFCSLYDGFVNHINNWAVCDTCSGKSRDLNKYKSDYFSYIEKYLNSSNPWAVRYAIITMFQYKKDEEYTQAILHRLNCIKNDGYYVKMAKAWLTAEMYVYHKDRVYGFLQESNYDRETMKMTLSKLRDSNRISNEDKKKLILLINNCLTT